MAVNVSYFCLVPTGDVKEASINSAILSTNCSIRGYGESAAIYFGVKDKYTFALKGHGLKTQTELNGLIRPAELRHALPQLWLFIPSSSSSESFHLDFSFCYINPPPPEPSHRVCPLHVLLPLCSFTE